jgi:hypothetical protein
MIDRSLGETVAEGRDLGFFGRFYIGDKTQLKPPRNERQRQERVAQLSKRARKLYDRIESGRFYTIASNSIPRAMDELWAAGLVSVTGRVQTIVAAFVPSTGYKPYREEQFTRAVRRI